MAEERALGSILALNLFLSIAAACDFYLFLHHKLSYNHCVIMATSSDHPYSSSLLAEAVSAAGRALHFEMLTEEQRTAIIHFVSGRDVLFVCRQGA